MSVKKFAHPVEAADESNDHDPLMLPQHAGHSTSGLPTHPEPQKDTDEAPHVGLKLQWQGHLSPFAFRLSPFAF